MKNKNLLQLSILSALLIVLMLTPLYGQNVKVFIMAGQSNMQGHGDVIPETVNGTLSHFMSNGGDVEFDYVQDVSGSWSTRDDVWIRYDHENGDLITGILDVGFGYSNNHIGPEFGFGHQLGQQTDDHVFIIKTCWGGTSLAVDFRPPSSGGATGNYYNQMISDIAVAIENIATDFPQYTGGNIEIAGMAWFQGWNDADEQVYLSEYEENLINLIEDVRADLNVPDLPFVIGLTGNGGLELEPAGTWVNALQTQIVPAQINAAMFDGHDNVSYVDTRTFWRDGDESPEPDFLHHWNNNGESYLRIGDALGQKMNEMLGQSNGNGASLSLGTIQPNTNLALPSEYNFQEYVFPEPDDQGDCQGIQNETALIDEVFLSQTHRHAIGHPLLFTIGERPVLLQIAVTGEGDAPDVQVEGFLDGNSLGVLCLNGPATLATNIDLNQPNLDDYFSVTLPKIWIKDGLELNLTAGDDTRILAPDDLKITPYTELNLVLVNIDIMDYNEEAHRTPIFDNFLQEVASSIPASVIRFGIFPETITLPTLAAVNSDGSTVILDTGEFLEDNNLNSGYINAIGLSVIERIQQSAGDFPNTIYFGNTLNLDPGGWGSDGAFVSFDYTDIFIHELGHAFSLPHWSNEFQLANPNPDEFSYPYGGEAGDGGGRGESWNFIQDIYEFVSPFCQDENGIVGTERSDAMQREFACIETRSNGQGPWDGFGDFSAKAINNFLLGSEAEFGVVEDQGGLIDFHLKRNPGYPKVTLVNGERVFTREASQPQNTDAEDYISLPGTEEIEQDVYLIYGSAHATMMEANIVYEPIKYTGTLLPNIDPTDPAMFSVLQNLEYEEAPSLYGESRDITLKLIYIDGTEKHVLIPFKSFERPSTGLPDEKLDPEYFAITVPADELLCGVELYIRDFMISDSGNDESGNINDPSQNITAANFMNDATLMATLDHSCNCPGTPGYIEPGTPCDDGNSLTTNDVEDGFCNCEGVPIVPCGFITNGQFEETLSAWWHWGSEASSTDGEASLVNINPDDAGIAQGPFEFNTGEEFTINFEAYASQPRSIEVLIYLDEVPETEYYVETVNLSTIKEGYELSFTFNGAPIINGAIAFNVGNEEADVFLDNVCLDFFCEGGLPEEPYNGIDDDCDPTTLDDDLDQDGFLLADDCDDTNPNINADEIEEPYNGIDDDCNAATFDDDLDQDGFLLANDCDDTNPNINADEIEEPYNGIDDDCNTATLDDDLDQDGFLLANDCDDTNPSINPDVQEIPNNGIDEDCDGMDLMTSTHEIGKTVVNIFPNPATNLITINIEGTLNFSVTLFDLTGKPIKEQVNLNQMEITSIATGIYLIEVKDLNTGQKVMEKITIIK